MRNRIGVYAIMIGVLVCVASPAISIWAAVNISQRSQCSVYRAQLAVYREVPPTTATGVALKAAYEGKIRTDCGGK